jgi:hypothetical protein
MDNIIKGVIIIEGLLLADIEGEVTNVCIDKLIFDKIKIKSLVKLQPYSIKTNCGGLVALFTMIPIHSRNYVQQSLK